MSKKDKTFVATIYGYDTMNHEKYCFSIDHFIDNYKEFAKDDFFWIFHSKKERDSFAFKTNAMFLSDRVFFAVDVVVLGNFINCSNLMS